jgi:hypothetical protein
MTDHMPGDFVLVTQRSDVGKLIRVGQWLNGDGFADYEHAAIYVGNGMLAEEGPKTGARIAPVTEYPADWLLWSSGIIPLTAEQRTAITVAAYQYVRKGTGYSFLDYLALASHRLHIPAPGLRAYVASSGHMICSQYVDQCYLNAGVHLFSDGRWQGYVTPGSLRQLLREHQ